jgi:hypothetical protein
MIAAKSAPGALRARTVRSTNSSMQFSAGRFAGAMRTEHHIGKPTLLDYGQGRLAAALNVVAASHISWCRECGKAAEAAANTREGPQQAFHGAPPVELQRRGQTAIKAMDRLIGAAETAGRAMISACRRPWRCASTVEASRILPGAGFCPGWPCTSSS